MKINVELLQKVAQYIVENPDRFYMGYWYVSLKEGACETGCIGGLAIFLAEGNGRSLNETLGTGRFLPLAASLVVFGDAAAPWDSELAKELFYTPHWPIHFQEAYLQGSTNGIKAKVAAEYIHYFIKNHETEC